MVKRKYVSKQISKLKKLISEYIENQEYSQALFLISKSGNLLYNTNLYYYDEYLEKSIIKIAQSLNIVKGLSLNNYFGKENVVFYYDGFGFDTRGLSIIYLKALINNNKVIYITGEQHKHNQPSLKKLFDHNSSEIIYIKQNSNYPICTIKEINNLIKKYKPKHFFYYSWPWDVECTTILAAYQGYFFRYLINLTDHAFWIGSQFCDKCIEFRNYGLNISHYYRNVPMAKLAIIPYYPIIEHYPFEGFPFSIKPNQFVFFSGGGLYKTISKNKSFYKIVEHVLKQYNNSIFWYAGVGNRRQINKLIARYPKRVFLTKERKDLYELLSRCRFYLNTYPIYGGLMVQYAASAGIVPVALKSNLMSGEFLINQDNLKIDFDNLDSLYKEIDLLVNDDNYCSNRGLIIKKSVPTKEDFENNIERLLNNENFCNVFEKPDMDMNLNLHRLYLHNIKKKEIDYILVNKCTRNHIFDMFLMQYIRSFPFKLINRFNTFKYNKDKK